MNEDLVQISKAQAHYSANHRRILKYTVEMFHKGLNEHKLISAPDMGILENKSNLQASKWSEKWKVLESKIKLQDEKEDNIDEANTRNKEALDALEQIDNLLIHTLSNKTLSKGNTVNWENFKKKEKFPEGKPTEPIVKQYDKNYPIKVTPTFTFFEGLFTSQKDKEKKYELSKQEYQYAITNWEKGVKDVDKYNSQSKIAYEESLKNWEKRQDIFYKKQEEFNSKIDELKSSYFRHNINSITEYCEMVLDNSEYPDSFPKNFELEYNPENKILIVEYELPSIECFPKVKEVKYLASKKELKESYIPESQLNKMFDDTMYKIALRSLHELFEADDATALQAISFNGWVNTINKATGKKENNCILSIQVKKDEFTQIDLSNVDPKTCFKNLKGVSASKLSCLTPIQPILQISKTDKRFVESYNVADTLNDVTNIAAMDWEDFEHLIRELFEKEFKSTGGEVKVTRASRDGGVDAVAFDPDPIRGGKIIIQAKRYTNTVGVSAVRDLYGTILNEGATKGILVTTADYGADSYEFAKGKPITLLNGSNLLHLLEKHGHHAKIDLKEAKKQAGWIE